MHLTLKCPGCKSALPVNAVGAPVEVRCGRCAYGIPLSITGAVRADHAVDVCPVCTGRDFYVRKDFDPKVGVAVVVSAGLISGWFLWFGFVLVAFGVLAVAALLDLVIYRLIDDLSVCYRCHVEFRGRYDRTALPFDLHTADLLELEWGRELERRSKKAKSFHSEVGG